MKKPKPRKKLTEPPPFDDMRAAIMQLVGNRYAPPTDDAMRDELYQPMLRWAPTLIVYLEAHDKEGLRLLDQALRPLRQHRADLTKALGAAEAETAQKQTFRETALVLEARAKKKLFDDLIATLTHERQVIGVEGWTWLWEVLPAAIERMMRTTNPQYPRSGKRTEGKTEREPAGMTARIMHAVVPLFTGEQTHSAAAIDKELQRLAKLKTAILDLHDQGQTVQQIAEALLIDFDEAYRILVRDGRL